MDKKKITELVTSATFFRKTKKSDTLRIEYHDKDNQSFMCIDEDTFEEYQFTYDDVGNDSEFLVLSVKTLND